MLETKKPLLGKKEPREEDGMLGWREVGRGNHHLLLSLINDTTSKVANIPQLKKVQPHQFMHSVKISYLLMMTSKNILKPPKMVCEIKKTEIADHGGF